MTKKLIGISLSGCVEDIVKGNVAIEDVEKIVTGTMARGDDIWQQLLADYADQRWCYGDYDPQECVRIAQQLKDDGKIEQPRLDNSSHYPVNRRDDVLWVESEDDIRWNDMEEV